MILKQGQGVKDMNQSRYPLNHDPLKFTSQGEVIPYYGTSIISDIKDRGVLPILADLRDRLMDSLYGPDLILMPEDSWHMTIMTLLRQRDRGGDLWPDALKGKDFSEVDSYLKDLVDQVEKPGRIAMRVKDFDTSSLYLEPVDDQMGQLLQDYRDRIAQATGIRHPNHDRYHFHITLAYISSGDFKRESDLETFNQDLTDFLNKRLGVIEFGPPNFVIFNDMLSYHEDLSERGGLY